MKSDRQGVIRIVGARQHNLKNISLEIPRDRLTVITGPSGSGKSSLAFNTLLAEGQARYVESLSAYARQFLDQMEKPDVDFIEGLSPAIAIEQRASAPNPRSTIATATEIYDYLRVLYSSCGQPHDPATGEPVRKFTPTQIAEALAALPEGARVILLAPVAAAEKGDCRHVFERLRKQGFVRVRADGEIVELDDDLRLAKDRAHAIEAVVDRLAIRPGLDSRLADSVETALRWSGDTVAALIEGEARGVWREERWTTTYANPRTGFTMPELTPKHFSFNSHLGACPACQGIGSVMKCDPTLLVPDPNKSINAGAIKTWWAQNKKLKATQDRAIAAVAAHFGANPEEPFAALPEAFTSALFYGTGDEPIKTGWKTGANTRSVSKPYEGLARQAERLYEESESEFTKRNVSRFMNPTPCPQCGGKRLKPEILAVTLASAAAEAPLSIEGFCALPVGEALAWIGGIALDKTGAQVAADVLREIRNRLRFLDEVGLGYLTLDRGTGTLSGGEAQRIRLATQIGSGLAGVLYVLDEPSIGLHQSDNARLIKTLVRLRDLGNTVIVVEHDEETMRAADYLVDLGPGAGPHGGEIMALGTPDEVAANEHSPTGRFLSGRDLIPVPKQRVAPGANIGAGAETEGGADLFAGDAAPNAGWLTVRGAREHNLRGIDAAFPAGCLTCVAGASGSGKSTLVDDILRRALFRYFYSSKDAPGAHDGIDGIDQFDKAIVIDQSAIGRSPRSNPATYVGAFGPIRDLFCQLPAAKVRGYDAGRFSFNKEGGRCEACKGDGMIKIDMHFLSDVYVTCESCRGQRYNRETLEITFKGRNIAEVLAMSIEEAERFFGRVPAVRDKLAPLREVGLGYLRLGQSATTLSGGEAQRVKLSAELAKKSTGRTLYILDEPTTGLHFADIQTLLRVLVRLRDQGNTLIVIEHNLDVIKCADWVLELGPGGGKGGGQIVAQGTPEQIARCAGSPTGEYLAKLL
ncbi:MAG: excinuclease ABC subunit UvrA [Verrucomicrobiales bacterium]